MQIMNSVRGAQALVYARHARERQASFANANLHINIKGGISAAGQARRCGAVHPPPPWILQLARVLEVGGHGVHHGKLPGLPLCLLGGVWLGIPPPYPRFCPTPRAPATLLPPEQPHLKHVKGDSQWPPPSQVTCRKKF